MPITEVIRVAAIMLKVPVEELDDDLIKRLTNINELCKMLGHDLRSVQLVACVVETWARETGTPIGEWE